MADLSEEPVKAPQSQNPPGDDVKANPDPNPEDDITEENRRKTEAE